MSNNIPVISFVGYSGSGKTTFIEKLIPELKKRGIRLAVIKHDAHKFTVDKEGKDTWRFAKAGADIVAISSSEQLAVMKKTQKETTLKEMTYYIKDVDLIITEGYRAGDAPKIGVYRTASGKELSVPLDELIAVISDVKVEGEIPCCHIEDVSGAADFLQEYIAKEEYPTWLSLEEGRSRLLELPVQLQSEYIGLKKALNRVLAEDVTAEEMIPHFSRSPLDGYAFRAADTTGVSKESPVSLRILEEVPAGTAPSMEVIAGTAVKILTGAPIPKGADAVIRYEDTEFDEDQVTIFQSFKPDTNIVPPGEDIKLGSKAVEKGGIITPAAAGVLASLGIAFPKVYKKPVITLINTGDELVEVHQPLAPAKIRNSSQYSIGGYLEQAGTVVLNGGIAKDTAQEIAQLIKAALVHSDMIITTGGVSVGDYDMVRNALNLLEARILFWKITMKPGSAVLAALIEDKLVLALSGNPASAIVSLQLLGMPYIYKLTGREKLPLNKIKVSMLREYGKTSPNGRYLRGKLVIQEGRAYFEPIESQKNGSVSSLQGCDLIGEIVPGTSALSKGDIIEAYWI